MNKNPGTKLFFSRFGGEQPIPPEFIAAMQRYEEEQSVPNEEGPEELSDTIVESEVKTDRANERSRRTIKKKPGPVGPLASVSTNDQGRPVQLQRTLVNIDTKPVISTATRTAAEHNLGNGWKIQEVAIEGYYIGGVFTEAVFGANKFTREVPNVTPTKFRVGIPDITTRVDEAGIAVDPTLTAGEFRESQEQITQDKKRTEITTQAALHLPRILDQGRETNSQGQDVVVTETLLADGTVADVSTVTKEVSVEQLGDGTKHMVTKEKPTTAPEVGYTVEIPDNVPREFAVAVPTTEVEYVIPGAAQQPILSPGDLRKSEKQRNVFEKLVRILSRAGITLPVSLVSKATNAKKQVITITKKYRAIGLDPLPSATRDVTVDNLGDQRVIETLADIPSVFPDTVISRQLNDPIPPEFQNVAQGYDEVTTETTVEGQAGSPPLATNEIAHSEQQIDTQTKRIRSTVRTPGALSREIDDAAVEGLSVGGSTYNGTVVIARVISNTFQSVSSTFRTIFSRLKVLGNGFTLLEQGTIVAFPTLVDKDTDPATGLITTRTKNIVVPGNTPASGIMSRRAINKDHTEETVETVDTTAFDSYKRIFEGTTNVDLPAVLVGLTFVTPNSGGAGNYSENGYFNIFGNGSGSLSLQGQCSASSMIAPEVVPEVRQAWANNIPCTHVLFLVPDNRNRSQVLTLVRNLLSDQNITDWPKFSPKEVTVLCQGESCSGTARAAAAVTASIRTNYNGDPSGEELATSSGGGATLQVELTVKTIRVPPTLHAAIPINGGITTSAGPINNADAQISGNGSGQLWRAQSQANSVFRIAGQAIGVGTVPATSPTTIPSGNVRYLHRLIGEPYVQNYIKMHAEIINANDIG